MKTFITLFQLLETRWKRMKKFATLRLTKLLFLSKLHSVVSLLNCVSKMVRLCNLVLSSLLWTVQVKRRNLYLVKSSQLQFFFFTIKVVLQPLLSQLLLPLLRLPLLNPSSLKQQHLHHHLLLPLNLRLQSRLLHLHVRARRRVQSLLCQLPASNLRPLLLFCNSHRQFHWFASHRLITAKRSLARGLSSVWKWIACDFVSLSDSRKPKMSMLCWPLSTKSIWGMWLKGLKKIHTVLVNADSISFLWFLQ